MMMPAPIDVLAMPAVDPGRHRQHLTVPAGTRIRDILAEVLPLASEEELRGMVRVSVGGQPIPPELWHGRPKPGHLVVVRVLPGDALKSALMIFVAIAANFLAPGIGNALFGATLGTAGTGIAAAGIALAGSLLLNALIPPPKTASGDSQSPTYDAQGWRNVATPNGALPAVLGRHRMAPVQAASSFTELIGDQQYIRALFTFGYGPLQIENIRIGETTLGHFEGVETEIREGWSTDDPITLYRSQVIEEQFAIPLYRDATTDTDWVHIKRSQSDVTALSVDFTARNGLFMLDKNGSRQWLSARFGISHRLYDGADGTGAWTWVADVEFGGANSDTIRRTHYWEVPTRGRYEVRIIRLDKTPDDGKRVSRVEWTALRSYRPEPPIAYSKAPLALIAIRIKASDQLNGTLDELTADVTRICLDWDAPTSAWVMRPTRNPASLARWAVQGPATANPRSDAQLILGEWEDWHVFCAANGLTYERVHDTNGREDDEIRAIFAAGRASPREDGDRLGVIIDRPRSQIVAAITPRNSRNARWRRTYFDPPDGWRCTFRDRTDDYAEKEMVVPWPGFTGDIQKTEDIPMQGVTDPTQLWKALRRRQLELEYRADSFQVEQDLASLESSRGDLVLFAHDIVQSVHAAGRVTRVVGPLVELDQPVVMVAGTDYAIRFRRRDRTTSVRRIVTEAGAQTVVQLSGDGLAPAAADAFIFGILGSVAEEMIVNRIDRADGFGGTLHLMPAAPEIDDILAATTVPAWDGRVGVAVAADTTPPPAPALSIVSGEAAAEEGATGLRVIVSLGRGAGAWVELASYRVYHRLAGASGWTLATCSAADGRVVLTGYAAGDAIEAEAEAVSIAGITGARSATYGHVVAASDPAVPAITAFDAVALASGARHFTWTLADHADDGTYADLITAKIRYGVGSGLGWGALVQLHSGLLAASPFDSWSPAEAATYTFGIVSVDSAGRESSPVLITRSFAALPAPPPPVALSAALDGMDVAVSVTAPNSSAFAAARVWRAASGAGFGAATDISGPIYGAANAVLGWRDLAPAAGAWDYYATAENTAGTASAAFGPAAVTVP
ncbi:host specificity factor TipJ family phage tail protein [Ancylobacter lacus]|uniref:host specificity factor TipJ family phage tail protein n=1 Tax=Ancylobacter lacus TaxID=2579970 RepID=UPI001BD04BB1|nr:host specificity factor TipJ family phage tail protein [Ancylobacter lacus]MBS7538352.1 hypothetical protein [Ancylobacter lacus]